MQQHLVIAGGGQAAAQTAQSARQNGYDGRISIIARESSPPYQRPPLSKKFLAGELAPERLLLKSDDFYRSRDIELVTGTRVTAIDPARSIVRLESGAPLEYTELVVATGGTPRRLDLPGSELDGVFTLRSIADVEAIRAEFAPGRHLLVIGAGYIGLEVAAVAVAAGLAVTVVEAGDRPLARSVSSAVSAFYADYHRQAGVRFRFGSPPRAFVGDDRIRAIEMDEGDRIECDLVIVGIGIEPETEIAQQAGLDCSDGIVVDAGCRTSAPGIFAAGDCARHHHPWIGSPVRLESVQAAIEQGKAAAASVVGRDEPFSAVPWFWSDQYDLKLQIAGWSRACDTTVVRGKIDSGSFSVFYLAGDRVLAVDAVNDPRTYMLARQKLADKPRWPAAAIADTDTDLAAL